MKITKTFLRKRWKTEEFLNEFPLPLRSSVELWHTDKKLKQIQVSGLSHLDLRGISDDELWFFPSFSDNHHIDFSYGKGAVDFYGDECSNLIFESFNFDRATYFSKIKISNSNFRKSKLIWNATDTTFEDCNFSETIFKGGFNEFGFRRCTFINCTFNNSQWKNLYFFACKFKNCNFENFTITKAKVGGFKVDKLNQNIKSVFVDSEVDGLMECDF